MSSVTASSRVDSSMLSWSSAVTVPSRRLVALSERLPSAIAHHCCVSGLGSSLSSTSVVIAPSATMPLRVAFSLERLQSAAAQHWRAASPPRRAIASTGRTIFSASCRRCSAGSERRYIV